MGYHCGYNVGQEIRAYDLNPLGDNTESYIEGVIVSSQSEESGGFGYGVKCTVDTIGDRVGRVIFVPYKLGLFIEFHNRVFVIKRNQ